MRWLCLLVVPIAGCSLPFDDFTPTAGDGGVSDSAAAKDAALDSVAADSAGDACTCTKFAGGKCREWNPPGCGN
jgi:hypothetical protein